MRCLACLVASAGDFRALQEGFHHDVLALFQRKVDGGAKLCRFLHLGGAEAASAAGGLYKAGQANAADDVLVAHLGVMTLADEQAVGHAYAERAHVVVQHKLVIRHGLHQHVAGAVGHPNQVKIALQNAVFARCAMNGDITEVGTYFFFPREERKIVAVHGGSAAVLKDGFPASLANLYLIYYISVLVQKRFYAGSAAHADVVFGGVSSANDCYDFFHWIFLHFSNRVVMSSGMSLVKNISFPVVGCTNPRVLACSTWRGHALKQFWMNWR